MKKIAVFIVIAAVACLLFGCVEKPADTAGPEPSPGTTAGAEPVSSPGTSAPPAPENTPARERKPAIFPEPSGEVIPSGTITVEAFLEKVNAALRAAGWDELLLQNASIDDNMDESPYPDFYFIYFNYGGYEIDFVVNRDTHDLLSIFISILSEDEYDMHEIEYYFKLFLILLEPNAFAQILDELDEQTISYGEDWLAMRQSALLNISPNI